MAITPMKKAAVLVPSDAAGDFAEWLHSQAVLHVEQIGETLPENYRPLAGGSQARETATSIEDVRKNCSWLEETLSFCSAWGGARKGFLENILSARTVASPRRIQEAATRVDAAAMHAQVTDFRSRRDGILQRLAAARGEMERLRIFQAVEVPLAQVAASKRIRLILLRLPRRSQEFLIQSAQGSVKTSSPALAWEQLEGPLFWFAFPQDDKEAGEFVEALGGEKEQLPALEVPAAVRLKELEAVVADLLAQLARIENEMRAFAANAPDVELALAYWQSELDRLDDLAKARASSRIAVTRGWLPARKVETFTAEVRRRFNGEVLAEDPVPGEQVPVNLTLARFFRPAQLLVNMFGVPDYFSIDPTPFITITFLIFFGICFSDAVYGAALIILSAVLLHRFRRNESLRRFFTLFLYAGVSTVVFGALTGSWAADLYKYLPEGNALARLRNSIPYIDLLEQPLTGLVIVIFIGVINQYFGIVMKMAKDWKKGDWKGAVFDGGLWFLYLSGMVILISSIFARIPAALMQTAWLLLIAGAIGLVLTQGRSEPTFLGKAITGVVSLYGILGSYGATSFIGDTLSYSRLLALGLTTGIVGMSFNIIGSIASRAPAVGTALFIGVVLFGHTFNFLMSIIGAFVHPARLILLEFFGRFYDAGGYRYQPFGVRSEIVEITEGGA